MQAFSRSLTVVVGVCFAMATVASRETPSRSLSECTDIPGWKDDYDWGCKDYEKWDVCGGKRKWNNNYDYDLSYYTDKDGVSAAEACCACGGGSGSVAPTKSPTRSTTALTPPTRSPTISPFVHIKQQIKGAPKNGTITKVIIKESILTWRQGIHIESGQNIHLIGEGNDPPILDAQNAVFHLHIDKGATFSATNLSFRNAFKGSISSEGNIVFLNKCEFRGNKGSAKYAAALHIYGEKSNLGEISNCIFENNNAKDGYGALAFEYMHIDSVRIVNTTFQSNTRIAILIYHCEGSGLAIDSCHFKQNDAVDSNGGAFALASSPKLTDISITRTHFEGNKASSGGAIIIDDDKSSIDLIRDCSFVSNIAMGNEYSIAVGGAIINFGIIKAIESSRFIGNEAEDYGPDVYADAVSTTVIRDSQFLTPTTNGQTRVVGPIVRCDENVDIALCPDQSPLCRNAVSKDGEFGVFCGLACPLGQFGVAPDACTTCPKGKYGMEYSTKQAEACELCPKGTSNPFRGQPGPESCSSCSSGTYATMGAPQCFKVCLRGQKQISEDQCRDCSPGKTSSDDDEPECIACAPGRFSSAHGAPNCEKCPAGRRSNAYRSGCVDCERNTYSLDGAETCTPCNASSTSPPGATRCEPCDPGFVFDPVSQRECVGCPPGKRRDHTLPSCVHCEPGYVSKGNAAYCEPCKSGSYAAKNGTSCIDCPQGHYCQHASHAPILCPGNASYCPAKSAMPIIAEAGTYTNAARTKTLPCPPGFYCINGDKRPCPPNTFGDAFNLTADTCSGACSSEMHRYSNASATKCECLPTFVEMDTKCTCPPHMYLSDLTKRCVPCPDGLTKLEAGNEYSKCIATELSTTLLMVIVMLIACIIAAGLVYIMYKRSGSLKRAFRVLTNPLMTNIASMLLDVTDIVSDVISCVNVLNEPQEALKMFKPFYVVTLVTATSASLYLISIRFKAARIYWEVHEREQHVREGRRLTILRDQSQQVVPLVDRKMIAALELKDLQDAMKSYGIAKQLTRAMAYVMIFEDTFMLILNTGVFVTIVLTEGLFVDMARTNPFKILMMVFALVTSFGSMIFKLTKLKDKDNVNTRLEFMKEELDKRSGSSGEVVDESKEKIEMVEMTR